MEKEDKEQIRISFDAWFASTGRPAHHKIGMLQLVNKKIKLTKEKWDSIFSNY